MNIIKPQKLEKGNTIGIVATGNPINRTTDDTIDRGYSRLKDMGFKIVEAPNLRKQYGHTAGTVKERADILNEFFENSDIDAIMAFWGGFQSHQLLEYLDFKLIKKNPKIFIGFSDTTSLLNGIHTKTGLVTFLGPAVITFAKPEFFPYTKKYFESVLIEGKESLKLSASKQYSDNEWWKDPGKKMIFKRTTGWKTYKPGIAEGKIVGGNMGTLLNLMGTSYFPDLKGKMLFVEDDEEEKPATVDRFFTQLRQINAFDKIKGLVIGRWHTKVGFSKNDSFEMILNDSLRGYKIPVLYDVDFGHTDPLLTIPLGIKCRLDSKKKEITYLESSVI